MAPDIGPLKYSTNLSHTFSAFKSPLPEPRGGSGGPIF